jgi:hypothetical protein
MTVLKLSRLSLQGNIDIKISPVKYLAHPASCSYGVLSAFTMKWTLFLPLILSLFSSTHAFSGSNSRRKNLLGRRAAAPYTPQFPYSGAQIDGLPGSQVGGILVPADGDTAHEYQDPPAGAQRGPCPGLNTAANHGFLRSVRKERVGELHADEMNVSRDGITTFDELVAAQQNVYNVCNNYHSSLFSSPQ